MKPLRYSWGGDSGGGCRACSSPLCKGGIHMALDVYRNDDPCRRCTGSRTCWQPVVRGRSNRQPNRVIVGTVEPGEANSPLQSESGLGSPAVAPSVLSGLSWTTCRSVGASRAIPAHRQVCPPGPGARRRAPLAGAVRSADSHYASQQHGSDQHRDFQHRRRQHHQARPGFTTTTDCNATGDGRKLSNRLEFTVAGPVRGES